MLKVLLIPEKDCNEYYLTETNGGGECNEIGILYKAPHNKL